MVELECSLRFSPVSMSCANAVGLRVNQGNCSQNRNSVSSVSMADYCPAYNVTFVMKKC